jgi:hypothetical protein
MATKIKTEDAINISKHKVLNNGVHTDVIHLYRFYTSINLNLVACI